MTTILAVDDSATMRRCLEITFSGTEFQLVTVDSAAGALEKVKTVSPALVIADVSLPPNDGYELCSTIKLAAPSLPVLMLSSKQHPFDPTRGAQADGHIDKPFDTQVMQDKARELVRSDVSGDTDQPPFEQVRPQIGTKPVAMPERAPNSKIPAPRRKRPTPAMMAKPEIKQPPPGPVIDRAAANIRRTVPFAMPGASGPRGIPGSPGLGPGGPGYERTMPMGAREQAASALLARGAEAAGRNPDLNRTEPSRGIEPGRGIEARRQPQGHESPRPPQVAGAGVTAISGTQVSASPASARAETPRPAPEERRAEERRAPTDPFPTRRKGVSDTLPGVRSQDEEDDAGPATPALPTAAHHQGPPLTPAFPAPTPQPPMAHVPTTQLDVDGATSLQSKLEALGLTKAQIEGVLALSRDLLEQVVWEVVPVLAETMIREEIKRLTKE